MKKHDRHWASVQLEATLKTSDLDRMEIGTVFLVDPEMKELIDGSDKLLAFYGDNKDIPHL